MSDKEAIDHHRDEEERSLSSKALALSLVVSRPLFAHLFASAACEALLEMKKERQKERSSFQIVSSSCISKKIVTLLHLRGVCSSLICLSFSLSFFSHVTSLPFQLLVFNKTRTSCLAREDPLGERRSFPSVVSKCSLFSFSFSFVLDSSFSNVSRRLCISPHPSLHLLLLFLFSTVLVSIFFLSFILSSFFFFFCPKTFQAF